MIRISSPEPRAAQPACPMCREVMPRAERSRLQYYEKHHHLGTIIHLVTPIDWIWTPSQLCPALQ
eukprot:15459498-Alexandrium_andersonii.AAC.1